MTIILGGDKLAEGVIDSVSPTPHGYRMRFTLADGAADGSLELTPAEFDQLMKQQLAAQRARAELAG